MTTASRTKCNFHQCLKILNSNRTYTGGSEAGAMTAASVAWTGSDTLVLEEPASLSVWCRRRSNKISDPTIQRQHHNTRVTHGQYTQTHGHKLPSFTGLHVVVSHQPHNDFNKLTVRSTEDGIHPHSNSQPLNYASFKLHVSSHRRQITVCCMDFLLTSSGASSLFRMLLHTKTAGIISHTAYLSSKVALYFNINYWWPFWVVVVLRQRYRQPVQPLWLRDRVLIRSACDKRH